MQPVKDQSLILEQVAAFRATLEEIAESSVIVHLVDIRYATDIIDTVPLF